MIARSGEKNALAAHYEWLVLGVGLLALAGALAYLAMALGGDTDEAVSGTIAQIDRLKPAESGVKPLDMTPYAKTSALVKDPPRLPEGIEGKASFLASERRIRCPKCAKAIPGDANLEKCPLCGEAFEKVVVVIDADGDGLPDKWEKQYGLNPADASDAAKDADADGFTNAEEYEAKTDPLDKNDHPDYLNFVSITLPLKETKMPFAFTRATKIPAGWRLSFVVPDRKDNYGRKGLTLTATVGEKIQDVESKYDTGYVLKGYEPKTEKRAIKGTDGMTRSVDASEATVVRTRDGRTFKIGVQPMKNPRLAPVDVQATLAFSRTGKTFDVVADTEIDLNGTKYKVVSVVPAGKGAKVTLAHGVTGVQRVIESP